MTTAPTQIRILKFSGIDAESFLQGQLTSDVTLLGETWQFTGYCSPKGRLLCSGFLWRSANEFYLAMNAEIFEQIASRLKMYVMRSKVEISEVVGTAHIKAQIDLTNDATAKSKLGDFQIIADQPVLHCTEHVITFDLAASGKATKPHTDTNEPIAWSDLCVREGLPLISAAISDTFVPQMVNLELLNGVSFKKGCYTGQEIVARMHYLGKLKQRMFRYTIEQKTASETISLAIGMKLNAHSENIESDSSATTVAQIVAIDRAASSALIVTRVSHIDAELSDGADANVRFIPASLPYSVEV